MLVANQQEMQLGTLKYGEPYNFKYVVTNSSTTQLIRITKLTVGCGSCTKASMQSQTIPPGESANIDVVFTPGSTGIQNKNISVAYTLAGNIMSPLILKFKASVNG